ncbi:MAG: nitroreductase family protein [Betaproteobacteria bacterium]|nr:nitroreductase family protein [Betaproteobacteria bacterium]
MNESSASPSPTNVEDVFATVRELIESRQTVLPKRLVEPGPTPAELQMLLALAAAAPDHGQLTPWRFIAVPAAQRHRLAEAFAGALAERDPAATPEQLAQAREKAYRAPLLLLAVACLGPREPDVPAPERLVSMGAALQNLLLGAHALGYGAGLTSGQAMSSAQLRRLCGLAAGEVPVCCVNIGTATRGSHRLQPRPLPAQLLDELPPDPADPAP